MRMDVEVLLALMFLSVTIHSVNSTEFRAEKNKSEIAAPRTFRVQPRKFQRVSLDIIDGISENTSTYGVSENTSQHKISKNLSRHRASGPSSGHRASDPSSGHRSSEPSSGHRASEPSSGHRSSEPSSGHRALEPSSGHRASEPSSGHRASEPSLGHRASEPSSGHRASEPSSGHRASEPSSGHRASEPSSGHRASEPSSGHRASEPSSGHSASEPSSGHRASEPSSGHRSSEPSSGHRASEPSSGHRASEPSLGHRALEPSLGHRSSEPSSGHGASEPSSGHRSSEPSSGHRSSEPSSGHRASEPSSGHRASEPSSGHKSSEAIPGHGISKSISNYFHNTELNKSNFMVNNSTLSYLRSSTSTKLIPAIYILAILIGIPSNAIILKMLFSRTRSVCTAIFYTNLAISDLLFCLMLPFKAAYHLNGNNWIFGEAMCRIVTIFFYGNMYCSILLLMCISISRYIAIVHPFIYRSLPKRTCAIVLCALVWIVVLMFMIPFFIKEQTYNLQKPPLVTCNDIYETSADAFQLFYFISLAVFGYLIPFSVITFCYFSIIRTLGSHDQKWYLYLKITILLLVIFALCFTPSNIILIIHQVRYHYTKMDDLYGSYLIALCFSSLNSCLDPFLYFLMSEITKPSNKYAKIYKLPNETHKTLLAS
ncbi:proteinase-activated receptor 3 [Rhinoderma darwinii]|uniref:proteinase-activated receptor 3 n=1 Tax=Rhinoderma darwinii TaxID=43563 RepID=UPI003F676C61